MCLLNPVIWGMNKSKEDDEEEIKTYKEREYVKTIQMLQEQVLILERENKRNQKKIGEYDKKKRSKKRIDANKAGCCGGENCVIM